MTLLIRFADGKVAGRTALGHPLRPVTREFAYIFTDDERGQAEQLAFNLTEKYGECRVIPVNNAHQGFVVGDGKWPGVCNTCGTSFEGIRPGMDLCHGCWYIGALQEADNEFAPLAAIIQSAGFRTEVWQTGGMVMCLAAFPTDLPAPYFMWSEPEPGEDDGSFCVYLEDMATADDTMQDLCVIVRSTAQLPALLARWEHWVELAKDPNTEEVEA